MPTVNTTYEEISRLLKKEIPKPELVERLALLGIESEESEEGLKLEVPHNRPDLLSVEGIVRALKGVLGIKTGLPQYPLRKPKIEVVVDPSTSTVRPHIACGVIRDVKLDEETVASLMQVQEKLHATYCRKRKKASIGVYDLDTLQPPITYTTVDPEGIKFVPLEYTQALTPAEILRQHPKGVEYAHLLEGLSRYPVLIDSKGTVLSLPPIVNSEDTKVSANTKALFIDVTGLDRRVVESALKVLMTSLAERGFVLEGVRIKQRKKTRVTPQLKPVRKALAVKNTNQMLGLTLNARQIAQLAKKMRYGIARVTDTHVDLLVPPYRVDILHEVDLIEDIAIAYGYDKLEPTIPPVCTIGSAAEIEKVSTKIRLTMIGLGFTELMTYSLISTKKAQLFNKEVVEIANPVSEEYSAVRNSLIPSLLDAVFKNQQYPTPQKLFEIGDIVVFDEADETKTRTVRCVAGAIVGKSATFTNVRSVAEAVLRELGIPFQTVAANPEGFIEGRCVSFIHEQEVVGKAGEIHPEMLELYRIENPVAVFELVLGTI